MCAEKCIVYRDYWIRGLQASLGFYIATAVSLAVLTITKTVEYGTYVSLVFYFLCVPFINKSFLNCWF